MHDWWGVDLWVTRVGQWHRLCVHRCRLECGRGGAGSDPSLVVAPRTVPGPVGVGSYGWIGRPVSCSRRRRLMVVRRWAKYSTDNGANWTARVPAATVPVAVGGLSNGVTPGRVR